MKAWQIYWRGAAMGAADLVPGISGGTVAFILGIYPRLIAALASFKPSLLQLQRQKGWRAVWLAIDGNFLLSLVAGIVSSILLLAHLISYLMLNFPLHLNGLFFGLVAASAWVLAKEIGHYNLSSLLALVMGLLVASQFKYFLPNLDSLSLMTYFIAGSIAICAMLLPGMSGSFLLLILGLYQPLINALKMLDFPIILTFISGAAVGILLFSQLLNWLLTQYRTASFAFLLGFILASLKNIWPWQELISYKIASSGELIPLVSNAILPSSYSQLMQQADFGLSVSLIMLVSAGVVLVLSGRKQ